METRKPFHPTSFSSILPWRIVLALDDRHFASSSGRAVENAARIHAELAIGIGGRRSQACILLGAAVVCWHRRNTSQLLTGRARMAGQVNKQEDRRVEGSK